LNLNKNQFFLIYWCSKDDLVISITVPCVKKIPSNYSEIKDTSALNRFGRNYNAGDLMRPVKFI
jgi:hypothetical protein